MSKQLLIFSATDAASGEGDYRGYSALWASDGTAAGTHEVGGLTNAGVAGAGPGSLLPSSITALGNGRAVFMGYDQNDKAGLWVTDGTAAGTKEIGGLGNAGVVGASKNTALFPNYGIVAINGRAFFGGTDATGSVGLWVTDGTAEGTVEVGGLANHQVAGANPTGLTPYNFVAYGGKVFFQGSDINSAPGIWVSDGTVAGTYEIGGVGGAGIADAASWGVSFNYPAALNNGVVFSNYNAGANWLWFTDGTAAGTVPVGGADNANIAGVYREWGLSPTLTGSAGDKAFFGGYGSKAMQGLWVTDGTAAGTYEVGGLDNAGVDGVSKTNDLQPANITFYNGRVYFTGLDATDHQTLWTSDGTAAGTYEIGGLGNSGVAGVNQGGFYPSSFAVYKGLLYFAGRDSAGVPGLWKTDGTVAGTVEVVDSSYFSGSLGSGLHAGETYGGLTNLAVVRIPVAHDFLDHGRSELLIQNGSGAVVVGEVANGQASYTAVAGLGLEWRFKGDGDFFGDGSTDFLIQNTDGAVVVGDVENGQTAFAQVAALGSEWSFVGNGDFLANGRSQFLIENGAGAVVLGDAGNGQAQYAQVASLGSEWKFVATGDFLGTGRDAFLIRNDNSGAIVAGDVQNGQAHYTQVGALGSEWKFVGTGDFLGLGHDAFLIENKAGAVVVGDVQNGQVQYAQVGGLGDEWSFIGSGDYLGTDNAGFVIENKAGEVFLGAIANGQASYTQIGALGPEWSSLS